MSFFVGVEFGRSEHEAALGQAGRDKRKRETGRTLDTPHPRPAAQRDQEYDESSQETALSGHTARDRGYQLREEFHAHSKRKWLLSLMYST